MEKKNFFVSLVVSQPFSCVGSVTLKCFVRKKTIIEQKEIQKKRETDTNNKKAEKFCGVNEIKMKEELNQIIIF